MTASTYSATVLRPPAPFSLFPVVFSSLFLFNCFFTQTSVLYTCRTFYFTNMEDLPT